MVFLSTVLYYKGIGLERYYDFSQGSRLVFQSVVFQLIFATLNMFFRDYSNTRQKIENPAGPIFRAIFPISFRAKISLGSLCNLLELLFRKSVKRCSNCLQRESNDLFALNDKGKIALKIGPAGFSIFCLLFEYSLKNIFRVAKISWKTTLWKTRRDP